MTAIDPNFRDLLKCFNDAEVRYLVVGGYAVNFHGYHRNTADFDIWIEVAEENARRISGALQSFGFPARAVTPATFLVRGDIHSFGRPPFRVDLLTKPDAVEFEACYARRVEAELDGLKVPFIALQDLKANKKASGRTKDLADLESLPSEPKKRSRKRKGK